jgi:Mg-chelatase subunit ChlD
MQRLAITLIAASLLLVPAGRATVAEAAGAEAAAAAAETAVAERPQIEVVFVLDTTGSMGGLIAAAKVKIWAIANTLATTKPAPEIKMGLIGFRDLGDEYVTKRTDLTNDLDAIHGELMGFKADGGGDEPESVNQALNEAVTAMSWSKGDTVYRVIFLVGDSPPHMDYADDVKYADTCKLAAEAGIIINTIQCGENSRTTPIWEDIAAKAEGRAFRVEQSGSAVLASTPFDDKLAELSEELEGTHLYYGTEAERQAQAEREAKARVTYEEAPAEAKAGRAVYSTTESGKDSMAGRQELVDDVADARVKLDEIATERLPENMQKMTAAEREQYIKEMTAKRQAVEEKIKEVGAQRQSYIEEQVKANADKPATTLDEVIFDSVKEQAARQGIVYEGGPSY